MYNNFNSNKFNEYSEKERLHIISLMTRLKITTYKMTDTTSYDKWDVTFTSPKTNKLYMAECKVRNYTSNDLIHHSLPFIEIPKLKAILNASANSNRIPLYINFTYDNKALIYNLSRYLNEDKTINEKLIKEHTGERMMNRQTASSTTDKIIKKIIELKYNNETDKMVDDIIPEVKPLFNIRDIQIQILPEGGYELIIIKNKFKVDNLVEWLLENKVVNTIEEAKMIQESNSTINILNFFK